MFLKEVLVTIIKANNNIVVIIKQIIILEILIQSKSGPIFIIHFVRKVFIHTYILIFT